MHLLAISLLTLLAGTLLLAKFRKDNSGKVFTWISWFFIIVGLLLFLGSVGFGICRMSKCGYKGKTECRQEMMMKERNHGMMDKSCCPQGMGKGMCPKHSGCMGHDSMMQGCSGHMEMEGDSVTVTVIKKVGK